MDCLPKWNLPRDSSAFAVSLEEFIDSCWDGEEPELEEKLDQKRRKLRHCNSEEDFHMKWVQYSRDAYSNSGMIWWHPSNNPTAVAFQGNNHYTALDMRCRATNLAP